MSQHDQQIMNQKVLSRTSASLVLHRILLSIAAGVAIGAIQANEYKGSELTANVNVSVYSNPNRLLLKHGSKTAIGL